MRIVFCGSGTLSEPPLRAVLAAGHEVPLVVTQPPRPAGRGRDKKLRPTPLSEAARGLGLETWECPNVNTPQAVERLSAARADVMCVADFGQFIRAPARERMRLDAINLHASLLPALRGAAPINWALIRCWGRTGVTTFSLVDAMDAGPIYVQLDTEIRPGETAEELRGRLADLGARAMAQTLELLASGRAQGRAQDESQATRAPCLKKSDGLIDWSAPARSVCGLICGTWPWPGGQTVLSHADGKETHVIIARAVPADGAGGGSPGSLDEALCVAAGEGGRVRVLEIKPAGKRLMTWQEFVNGYRPAAGDLFVTVKP